MIDLSFHLSPTLLSLIRQINDRTAARRDLYVLSDKVSTRESGPFKATVDSWPVYLLNYPGAILVHVYPREWPRELWFAISTSSWPGDPETISIEYGILREPPEIRNFGYFEAIDATPEEDRRKSTFDAEEKTAAVDHIMAVLDSYLEPLAYEHERTFIDFGVTTERLWDDRDAIARLREAVGTPGELELTLRDRGRRAIVPFSSLRHHQEAPQGWIDHDYIGQLTDSIVTYNLIDPILVRELAPGIYEIIEGHRRLLAWQRLAQVGYLPHRIPAYIVSARDENDARRAWAAKGRSAPALRRRDW